MKLQLRLLLLLIAASLSGISGCRKVKYQGDPTAYYPKVSTQSVDILPDGSVKVTGLLSATGSGALDYVGFCLDTAPDPQMHINQILSHDFNGTTFSVTYKKLNALRKYYVRSFAANEYGYAYGNNLTIENAGLDTNTIDCHPGSNVLRTEGGGYSTVVEPVYSVSELDPMSHRAYVYGNSMTLNLEFGRTPISGKYPIVENMGVGDFAVTVLYTEGGGGYWLNQGDSLYVQQVDASRIRVWICHQQTGLGNYLTTNFTTK